MHCLLFFQFSLNTILLKIHNMNSINGSDGRHCRINLRHITLFNIGRNLILLSENPTWLKARTGNNSVYLELSHSV